MTKSENEPAASSNQPAPATPSHATIYKQPRTYLVSSASLVAWGLCTVLLCVLCIFIGMQLDKASPARQGFMREQTGQYRARPTLDTQPGTSTNNQDTTDDTSSTE